MHKVYFVSLNIFLNIIFNDYFHVILIIAGLCNIQSIHFEECSICFCAREM